MAAAVHPFMSHADAEGSAGAVVAAALLTRSPAALVATLPGGLQDGQYMVRAG